MTIGLFTDVLDEPVALVGLPPFILWRHQNITKVNSSFVFTTSYSLLYRPPFPGLGKPIAVSILKRPQLLTDNNLIAREGNRFCLFRKTLTTPQFLGTKHLITPLHFLNSFPDKMKMCYSYSPSFITFPPIPFKTDLN